MNFLNFTILKALSRRLFSLGLLFVCLLTTSAIQAQAFSFTASKTDETCSGNATLTMTAENVNPGATVTYSIYLLPSVTPLAIINNGLLERLAGGSYRIVATQSNPNISVTQDIEIQKQIIPLEYAINGTNITCGNLGSMTIEVFSGTAAFYEIISGPVVALPQSSPYFPNLPPGEYRVRVTDDCGQGAVMTYTLFEVTPDLTISAASYPINELPNCNSIIASHNITPARNTELTYPLYATYTINPPGGAAAVVIHNTIMTGAPDREMIQTSIPFFYGQPYTYTIDVADNCSNTYTKTITVNQKLKPGMSKVLAYCGTYSLTIEPANLIPPFTVNFISKPATFDPVATASGAGPYTSSVTYGDFNHPVPFGNYRVQVSDGCGRSETSFLNISPQVLIPTVLVEPFLGCLSGKSKVSLSLTDRKIVTASLLQSPLEYATALPLNLTSLINTSGKIIFASLPAGFYKLTLTDDCGESFPVEFNVPPLDTKITTSVASGCAPGKGSLRITAEATTLQTVILTAAPLEYSGPTGDVSQFINRNTRFFSMADLPPGNYRFEVTNSCNIMHIANIVVEGYDITTNTLNVAEHCGSFDLTFSNTSNSTLPKYWLQKFNSTTQTWGHPQSGNPYTDGSKPTVLNSFAVTNNATAYNIGYNGNFRIVKYSECFENGNIGLTRGCTEVIHQFSFFGALEIMTVEKTNCNGLNSDIRINAVGFPPLSYEIESKNGLPFHVPNGSNPVFTNLEAGIYKFKVIDGCTNFTPRTVDISILPSILSTITTPPALVGCENADNNGKADFDLRLQNRKILGILDPALYNITYHLSESEATTDTNPLPLDYQSENVSLHARVEYNNRNDCYGIVAFDLIVNDTQPLQMPLTYYICPDGIVTITADPGFFNYEWSTGEQHTNEITVNKPGTYRLIITENTNGSQCFRTVDFTVILSPIATIDRIDVKDWTNDENSITVYIHQQSGNYSYSLDNVSFQESNTFVGLTPGDYTVYIRDSNGCDSMSQEVTLMDYPRYFTPNNDGFNDVWKINNSHSEPNIELSVFDRYGRLVKVLKGNSSWDGTINGQQLPADDYWFVITRENGKTFRGHFSLKR